MTASWIALGAALAGVLGLSAAALWWSQRRFARVARELRRARHRLAQEAEREHHATEAFRLSEARARALAEAVPAPVFYVDRDGRCRMHNRAAARLSLVPEARLDGAPLREALGEEAHAALAPHLERSLAGASLQHPLDGTPPWTVAHAPFPPGGGRPAGVHLVLLPRVAGAAAAEPPAPSAAGHGSVELRVAREGGEALYLRAIAAELTGWDDPQAKLADALEHDRFLLMQQRILPLGKGAADASCCEILLRLQEEEDHLLPPGGFLPLAESYGMMEQVDRWVVRTLVTRCRERALRERGWRAPLYWVNLSGAAMRSAEFARSVQRQVQDGGFDGRRLCFELAEPDVVRYPAEAERLIGALRPLGCRFAMDAFGSVRPAFAEVHRLRFDFVKIDGVIVQNMLRDRAELARVRAIQDACRRIGVRTCAELVEDEATLVALRGIGIDYAQGFGIARPEPLFGPARAPRHAAVPGAAA